MSQPTDPHYRFPERKRVKYAALLTLAVVAVSVGWALSDKPGRLYRKAERLHESQPYVALELLDECIRIAAPPNPQAELLRCRVWGRLGRWQIATERFGGIELDDVAVDELLKLLKEASKAGADTLANLVVDATLQTAADHHEVLRLGITVKARIGRDDEALKLCRQLASISPRDALPWQTSATIHFKNQKLRHAIEAFQELLERKPSGEVAFNARFKIASAALVLGDMNLARQHLDQLLPQRTESLDVQLLYARFLRNDGRIAEAIESANKVLERNPDHLDGLRLLGTLRLDKGDLERAASDLEHVLELVPYDRKAHYKLGTVYLRAERTDDAKRHFEESRRLTNIEARIMELETREKYEPSNRKLLLELAVLNRKLGRFEIAEYWRQSAQLLSAGDREADSSR